MWSRLGKPCLDSPTNAFQTADGSPLHVLGQVKLDFKLASLTLSFNFCVSQRLGCDCILGTDFLTENDGVVDLKENVLFIESEVIHLISQRPNCVSRPVIRT